MHPIYRYFNPRLPQLVHDIQRSRTSQESRCVGLDHEKAIKKKTNRESTQECRSKPFEQGSRSFLSHNLKRAVHETLVRTRGCGLNTRFNHIRRLIVSFCKQIQWRYSTWRRRPYHRRKARIPWTCFRCSLA